MNFETIDDNNSRAKVFGGWIVKTCENVMHNNQGTFDDGWDWRVSTCFVPDPEYRWLLTPCKGKNCGSKDGLKHSEECDTEHSNAFIGIHQNDGDEMFQGINKALDKISI